MFNEDFIKTITDRVREGIIGLLKEAKSKGKTLDDVIAHFEEDIKKE